MAFTGERRWRDGEIDKANNDWRRARYGDTIKRTFYTQRLHFHKYAKTVTDAAGDIGTFTVFHREIYIYIYICNRAAILPDHTVPRSRTHATIPQDIVPARVYPLVVTARVYMID